jgi:hypothetical protein
MKRAQAIVLPDHRKHAAQMQILGFGDPSKSLGVMAPGGSPVQQTYR